MNIEVKTEDGWTLRVFSSMYIDWGLEITDPSGEERYYSPSSLSNEAYGHKPARGMDWDEAEEAALNGDDTAFKPWTYADWKECLLNEADDFIEAYCPED